MDTDQGLVVLRRFSDRLHGATIATLHCESRRPASGFGADVVEHLAAEGLLGSILWSTSCTPADVSPAGFQKLRDSGLFLTKLDLSGVAGDASRLRQVVLAVQVLRRLGILVEYELDLFGGSATPVMSHLAESGKLSLADIREAERILNRQEKKR